jgi:hypothetical protein
MKNKVKVKENIQNKADQNECHHHWIIEAANGPKSRGVCKYCGETRDFFNSAPDFNTLKRQTRPIDLPKIPDVEIDENSQS